jgi:iron(III) transport system permease protein
VLDGEGEKFTFANYVKILGRPFYRGAVANTLMIGVAATLTTIVVSVPFAFALARLPVPGKAAIIALAAMPLVLPSFVSAYAIVLLLGRAGVVTQWLNSWGIGFGSIYGAGGHHPRLHADPLSLRAAADDGGLSRRSTSRSRKRRKASAPHRAAPC